MKAVRPRYFRGMLLVLLLSLLLGLACRLPTLPGERAAQQEVTVPSSPASGLSAPFQAADQSAALRPQAAPLPQDLTHYLIQVSIDYQAGAFQGKAVVDVLNRTPDVLDTLYFRLYPNAGSVYGGGWLRVTGVSIGASPVQTSLSTLDTVLEVPLLQPLPAGERLQVTFDFNGAVPHDFGVDARGYGIYNLSQGVLALAGWYPILAVYDQQGWNLDPVLPIGDPVYSQTALYTVDITLDSSVVLATTGVEVSRLQEDGAATHRYASGPARDFFIVASPEFQKFSAQSEGTTVNAYLLPGYEAAGERALANAQEALRIFNQRFGPYPYSELDAVQAPMNNAGGVEYPGIFLVEADRYDDPDGLTFLFTLVHEAAHQWWYSTVGNNVIKEPWLDEGLATYSYAFYYQVIQGEEAYQGVVSQWQNTYKQLLAEDRDQPIDRPVSYFVGIDAGRDYGAVVYIKAALALHELRQLIGDAPFFQALQDYYRAFYFDIATTADLLAEFERTSGQDLDAFYNQWFYTASQPPTETPLPSPTSTATPEPTATPLPTPTSPPPVSFAIIGDYGANNQAEEDVANLIDSWGVNFILTTGDNNYLNGEADSIDYNIGKYFHSYIFPYQGRYGEGASTIRFFPSLGNHDLLTEGGKPYFDYLNLPGNERYYDFVWGPVHLFALNSNDSEPNGVAESSTQAEWLRKELAASTVPWQVVYTHYPPYSSGYHGSTDWMRWPYQEWGADAVIAGHDHTYERLLINGFPYFVNGLGGGDIYDFDQIIDGSVVRFNRDYGAMLVHATADQMTFQFITRTGEVVDYYVLNQSP